MINPDLSIILPGIRVQNWKKLYDSIFPSIGKYSFELIIVGPHRPEEDLLNKSNVFWVEDYRKSC